MSFGEREQLRKNLVAAGLRVTVRKAFTVHFPEGPSINFFPPKAQWHHGVRVQAPCQLCVGKGRQNAIKKLKVRRDEGLKRTTEHPDGTVGHR